MVVYEGFYASQAPDVPIRLARYVRVSFKLQMVELILNAMLPPLPVRALGYMRHAMSSNE